ncbi:MAG: FKBP-type peptidyl-prolyl cis-trans isomerase [Rickettsiales bacterium]|jgi:FKBP-type peptidyl-prolyl cis-trans isomerase|nr:FKBP-type peptidyl-prolyl cis-trans isomerase [Rickettsiales bacterium]
MKSPWLKWAVIGIIGVIAFSASQRKTTPAPEPTPPQTHTETSQPAHDTPPLKPAETPLEKAETPSAPHPPAAPLPQKEPGSPYQFRLEKKDESFVGKTLHRLVSPIVEGEIHQQLVRQGKVEGIGEEKLKTFTLNQGTGPALLCGHRATYHYRLILPDGRITEDTRAKGAPHNEPLTESPLPSPVIASMIGMHAGESLRILKPMTSTPSGPVNIYEVDLESVTPNETLDLSGIQSFDKTFGIGEAARCGSKVSFRYTLKRVDGSVIETRNDSDTPLPIKLGRGDVMAGLEYGIMGMHAGAERTLIIPPSLTFRWQHEGYGLGENITLPENEVIIMDIALISVQ